MAKIEILWMFLEMTQHNFMNIVCFPLLIGAGRIRGACEGSELWALQVDGYVYRSNFRAYNSDLQQTTWILSTLMNPGKQKVFMKLKLSHFQKHSENFSFRHENISAVR